MISRISALTGFAAVSALIAGVLPGVAEYAAVRPTEQQAVHKGDRLAVAVSERRRQVASVVVQRGANGAVVTMRGSDGSVLLFSDGSVGVTRVARGAAIPGLPDDRNSTVHPVAERESSVEASRLPEGCERTLSTLVRGVPEAKLALCVT